MNGIVNMIAVTFHGIETVEELPFELYPNKYILDIYKLFDDNQIKKPETYYLAYKDRSSIKIVL